LRCCQWFSEKLEGYPASTNIKNHDISERALERMKEKSSKSHRWTLFFILLASFWAGAFEKLEAG
jgi:uncharacterized membrane protein YoaK (UPF0700 family)